MNIPESCEGVTHTSTPPSYPYRRSLRITQALRISERSVVIRRWMPAKPANDATIELDHLSRNQVRFVICMDIIHVNVWYCISTMVFNERLSTSPAPLQIDIYIAHLNLSSTQISPPPSLLKPRISDFHQQQRTTIIDQIFPS